MRSVTGQEVSQCESIAGDEILYNCNASTQQATLLHHCL